MCSYDDNHYDDDPSTGAGGKCGGGIVEVKEQQDPRAAMFRQMSASLFGIVFRHLANYPTVENRRFAKELWELSRHYDFSDRQMGSADALWVLGVK